MSQNIVIAFQIFHNFPSIGHPKRSVCYPCSNKKKKQGFPLSKDYEKLRHQL